jgi:hypothetical protein
MTFISTHCHLLRYTVISLCTQSFSTVLCCLPLYNEICICTLLCAAVRCHLTLFLFTLYKFPLYTLIFCLCTLLFANIFCCMSLDTDICHCVHCYMTQFTVSCHCTLFICSSTLSFVSAYCNFCCHFQVCALASASIQSHLIPRVCTGVLTHTEIMWIKLSMSLFGVCLNTLNQKMREF